MQSHLNKKEKKEKKHQPESQKFRTFVNLMQIFYDASGIHRFDIISKQNGKRHEEIFQFFHSSMSFSFELFDKFLIAHFLFTGSVGQSECFMGYYYINEVTCITTRSTLSCRQLWMCSD